MTRYLLDTNLVSEAFKARPSQAYLSWLERQPDAALYVSALTIGEIWRGVVVAPSGRKRMALEQWFAGPDGPPKAFEGRVLPFDAPVALVWAELVGEGELKGRPRSALDMILAATARVHGCVVATDNARHFAGVVEMINPLRGPV